MCVCVGVCVCVTKVVYACERQGQPHDTACSVSPVGGDWDTGALCMCVCMRACAPHRSSGRYRDWRRGREQC